MRKERLQVIIQKETKNLLSFFLFFFFDLGTCKQIKETTNCQGNNCQVAFRNNTPL
jgi:hypothetical protein